MSSETPIPFPVRTARFKLVVRRCGRPDVHLTLVPIPKDAGLQRLNRQSRVMTVHQAHRGTGADYGLVGLFPARGIQLLVFPKSLRRFTGKRIVGIDYSLLTDEAKTTGDTAAVPGRRKPAETRAKPKEAPPAQPPPRRKEPPPVATPDPVEPPTMLQILKKLQAVDRLLAARKYVPAKTATRELAKCIRAGLEPLSKKSR